MGCRQRWSVKFRDVCAVVFADGSCDVVGELSPGLSSKSADGSETCMVVSAGVLFGIGRSSGGNVGGNIGWL